MRRADSGTVSRRNTKTGVWRTPSCCPTWVRNVPLADASASAEATTVCRSPQPEKNTDACWLSPDSRTSVMVSIPSRGSLSRRSRACASNTLIRSANRSLRLPAIHPPRKPILVCDRTWPGHMSITRFFPQLEGFNDVTDLNVVVPLEGGAALESITHLGDIVLLPAQ